MLGKDERKVGAVLWQRSRLQKRALNLGIRSHCLQQKAGSTIGLNSHSSPVLLWHPPATYGNAHVAAHHCGPQGGKAWWRAVTPALAGTIGGSRPEQWNRCAGAEINRCAGKQDIRSTQRPVQWCAVTGMTGAGMSASSKASTTGPSCLHTAVLGYEYGLNNEL